MNSWLIRGGRIIDPGHDRDETGDVLVRGSTIAKIETRPGRLDDASAEVIDAEGLIVAPGLIDPHVHLREPGPNHDETIATGTAAAANGGFTTVCCMPNTTPPLDTAERVASVSRIAATALARVFVVGCATEGRQGERLAPLDAMARAGAVGFTDDGDVVARADMMQRVLRAARDLDRVVMQHCQEPSLTEGAAMNAGPLALRLGLTGWPALAEEQIIERDLRLNAEIGARYHAQHVSSGGSLPLLEAARQAGQPVSGEASPHHLLLTEEACAQFDTNAKMNPPLRTAADVAALREAIGRGVITILGTDHAPHPPRTKATDFASASFGIVGLDCALPLYARALIETGVLKWPAMIAMMTVHPAALTGLDRKGLGRLAEGGPADLTLIDPDLAWTIDAEDFASTGRNCPFDGWEVRGRAVATVVGGRPVGARLGSRGPKIERPAAAL